jgi:CRP/FNR family transcriptional regulator
MSDLEREGIMLHTVSTQDVRLISPLPLARASETPQRPVAKAVSCASCCLRHVCLPCELPTADVSRFGEIASAKRRVARGAPLFHAGDRFEYLHAVRSGAFKTLGVSRNGDEKVTGFHLAGEMLGLEAISAGCHAYTAVALEDSEVCAIPFAALEKLSLTVPALQHRLFQVISSDISRDQGLMLMLGSMSAEQRLAAFLLSLSRRYEHLGYSAQRFTLRMTREEIGNYLGLTLETVSRLFSRFQRDGLLGVQQREIELRNPARLREIVG